MAAIESTPSASRRPGLFSRFSAQLHRETEAFIRRKSRRAEILALEAKTDEELARMGIKRAEIAQYVFSDRIWF